MDDITASMANVTISDEGADEDAASREAREEAARKHEAAMAAVSTVTPRREVQAAFQRIQTYCRSNSTLFSPAMRATFNTPGSRDHNEHSLLKFADEVIHSFVLPRSATTDDDGEDDGVSHANEVSLDEAGRKNIQIARDILGIIKIALGEHAMAVRFSASYLTSPS